jgi:predicted peroxiredoxin
VESGNPLDIDSDDFVAGVGYAGWIEFCLPLFDSDYLGLLAVLFLRGYPLHIDSDDLVAGVEYAGGLSFALASVVNSYVVDT